MIMLASSAADAVANAEDTTASKSTSDKTSLS